MLLGQHHPGDFLWARATLPKVIEPWRCFRAAHEGSSMANPATGWAETCARASTASTLRLRHAARAILRSLRTHGLAPFRDGRATAATERRLDGMVGFGERPEHAIGERT